MKKLTLAVIFGGHSSEHRVSLQSASAVVSAIDQSKYDVVMLGIDPSGEWYRFTGDASEIAADTWRLNPCCKKAFISPSRGMHGVIAFDRDVPRVTRIDAAFPVLHGKNGEDGTVQGLLELAGIPVIGCKTLCSALCMDKDKAHKIAHLSGVKIPRSFAAGDEMDALRQAECLGYPLFVKPVKAGSSFGITKVSSIDQLPAAIRLAKMYDDEVIIEEAILGFEVGCAVMGSGGDLLIGEVDEIEIADGFFDYKEKYARETAAIHVPARVPAQKAAQIKAAAETIYRALGCTGFARVDMFLTPDGEIVFNEVNTIPGFTEQSRFPNMMKSAGYSFEETVNMLIETAVVK